jgi:hypothetical protein
VAILGELDKFIVYAVSEVEEALEILCDIKPGKLNSRGKYPKNTINYRVMERLKEIAELAKDRH